MRIGRSKRIIGYLVLGIAATALAFRIAGCEAFPESSFELAKGSRLPKWFAIPPGLGRVDVSITMNYYTVPWGPNVTFVLQDRTNKVLAKLYGRTVCNRPFSGYPSYEMITVGGTTEMIEHKKMEPIFYITDDPAVWKEYKATGCR